MLVGGLLRKKPTLTLPDSVPQEAHNWIMSQFAQDGASLTSFLDSVLWEEVQTSRAWLFVDYPAVPNSDSLTAEERKEFKPYPVLWEADFVINWRVKKDTQGKGVLDRVITYGLREDYTRNEFHPEYIETVWLS